MIPVPATTIARETGSALLIVGGAAVALLIVIIALALYFTFRYGSARNPVASDIEGHAPLELSLLGGSVVLVLFLFFVGLGGYERLMSKAPEGALQVKAKGRMWQWSFEYPEGAASNVLNLPAGRPVSVTVSSADVLHSLFIPSFRVKSDLLPGSERTIWFTPDTPGEYEIFCTEYCGTGHSMMLSRAVVMEAAVFDGWLKEAKAARGENAGGPAEGPASEGKALYASKGCSACHSVDGSRMIGPTWKGLYGSRVRVTAGGAVKEVTADEAYLKGSILDPATAVVEGFQPVMPPQRGVLTDKEVDSIIEYIKTIR